MPRILLEKLVSLVCFFASVSPQSYHSNPAGFPTKDWRLTVLGGIFKQIWILDVIPGFDSQNSHWNRFFLEQGIPSSSRNRVGNRVGRLTNEKSMPCLKINILWSMGNPLPNPILIINSNVQICLKIPPLREPIPRLCLPLLTPTPRREGSHQQENCWRKGWTDWREG